MEAVFQSSRVKDVLSPDRIILGEEGVIFQIRNLQENLVRYDDIAHVEIEHGVLSSHITVTIRESRQIITLENFTRSDAEKIKRALTARMQMK